MRQGEGPREKAPSCHLGLGLPVSRAVRKETPVVYAARPAALCMAAGGLRQCAATGGAEAVVSRLRQFFL